MFSKFSWNSLLQLSKQRIVQTLKKYYRNLKLNKKPLLKTLMLKAEIIHTTSKCDQFLMVLWKPRYAGLRFVLITLSLPKFSGKCSISGHKNGWRAARSPRTAWLFTPGSRLCSKARVKAHMRSSKSWGSHNISDRVVLEIISASCEERWKDTPTSIDLQ